MCEKTKEWGQFLQPVRNQQVQCGRWNSNHRVSSSWVSPAWVSIHLALNGLSGLNISSHCRYLHISVLETRILDLRDKDSYPMSQWSNTMRIAKQLSNIHLFENHLQSVSYVPGAVLGTENMHSYKHMDKELCLVHRIPAATDAGVIMPRWKREAQRP